MPFHNDVYYSLSSEPLVTHSRASLPSLLNSPERPPFSRSQSRASVSGMPGGPGPFKFQSRRESVDWRRINAVDVDRVAGELDFQTLQEHVAVVTFCSLEGERCMCCHSQVDPALLKLFRLAQLTLEYLLHSQDCLSTNLQAAEERLRAEAVEKEGLQVQVQQQNQEIKTLKEELKQRKKIISSQQAMISAGLSNYHKCPLCEKAFMNLSFLQCHMQRRHPTECNSQPMTDNQRHVNAVKLQEEINRLQEQLTMTRSQLEMQQKDHSAKQEKDLTQKQDEFMKQLEIWKEDERVRMNSKMDEVKQACQRDMDSLHQRNRNLEKEVLKLQQSCKMHENFQTSSIQNSVDKPQKEVLQLQQKLHTQEMKWMSKMQKLKEEHELEKQQMEMSLSQLRSSQSENRLKVQKDMEKMEIRLQEQQQLITAQNKKMTQLTSSSPKLVDSQEDSSSFSESLPETPSWQLKANELLRNPSFKKDMRLAVQQSLHHKLLSLGIQSSDGLSSTAFKKAMARVDMGRKQRQSEDHEYLMLQKDISRRLAHRVRERNSGGLDKPKEPVQAFQFRSRSSSLPTTVTKVVSATPPRQRYTPQSGHSDSSTQPKTSTPRPFQKMPTSSSDDLSEEDELKECLPQSRQVSKIKMQPPRVVQRSAPPPLIAVQKAAQGSRLHQTPVPSTNKVKAIELESESEWTEGSEIEEIALEQLQKTTDQNGNVQKASNTSVKAPCSTLKQKFTQNIQEKTAKNPSSISTNVVQELKLTAVKDDYEDDDDDDWDNSSLDDIPVSQKPHLNPVRKSMDKSLDSSTSVWGSYTGKGPDSGLKDAGTGSTLKSSIVTVTDWDDSDSNDFSDVK